MRFGNTSPCGHLQIYFYLNTNKKDFWRVVGQWVKDLAGHCSDLGSYCGVGSIPKKKKKKKDF